MHRNVSRLSLIFVGLTLIFLFMLVFGKSVGMCMFVMLLMEKGPFVFKLLITRLKTWISRWNFLIETFIVYSFLFWINVQSSHSDWHSFYFQLHLWLICQSPFLLYLFYTINLVKYFTFSGKFFSELLSSLRWFSS